MTKMMMTMIARSFTTTYKYYDNDNFNKNDDNDDDLYTLYDKSFDYTTGIDSYEYHKEYYYDEYYDDDNDADSYASSSS